MKLDEKTGMPWSVGVSSGLVTNINPNVPQAKYEPYQYKRKENGALDPRILEAAKWLEGKEPSEIVRDLTEKLGDR